MFLSEMGNKAKIVSKTEAEGCLSFNNLHLTMFQIATYLRGKVVWSAENKGRAVTKAAESSQDAVFVQFSS